MPICLKCCQRFYPSGLRKIFFFLGRKKYRPTTTWNYEIKGERVPKVTVQYHHSKNISTMNFELWTRAKTTTLLTSAWYCCRSQSWRRRRDLRRWHRHIRTTRTMTMTQMTTIEPDTTAATSVMRAASNPASPVNGFNYSAGRTANRHIHCTAGARFTQNLTTYRKLIVRLSCDSL